MSHNFFDFTESFCHLAITCPFDDETLKSLFWIGANYHHAVDLQDTTGLYWREADKYLESVYPRSGTQSDPDPNPSPSIHPPPQSFCVCPPADGERLSTAMSEPEPEERRTELTIIPEQKTQSKYDQGCEPTTPAAKSTLRTG